MACEESENFATMETPMETEIRKLVEAALGELGEAAPDFSVEAPRDLSHGDYASNAALVAANQSGENPKALAERLAAKLRDVKHSVFNKIEVAGPGFLNFFLSPEVFAAELGKILAAKDDYGRPPAGGLAGRKIMVEYTDPNPFKEFHLGHLMSNTIGETLSRLMEWRGAEVKRACYQGDVGMHVAKAVYGMRLEEANFPPETASFREKAKFLGRAYVAGATVPEFGVDNYQNGLAGLNKVIYDRSNPAVNKMYDWGRQVSLEYFETIYRKLGTRFDFYFFESEAGPFGKKLVTEWLGKGVFEESDGAIIFRGEHTRVFINAAGLPTYEAKELGLVKLKFEKYPYEQSIVIAGNEVDAYFRVLLTAMAKIFPDLAARTRHLSHGMLRLATGKMSSRTGEVITAESLITEVTRAARGNEAVAIGAIKFAILKQAPGRDIVFDLAKSLALTGDSGPYLQYAYARAKSVLAKVDHPSLNKEGKGEVRDAGPVEKLLIHFPGVAARAGREFAPQLLVTYLIALAGAFNHYYAENQIIGSGESEAYRLALTAAVAQVLANGLRLLGIPTPEKM